MAPASMIRFDPIHKCFTAQVLPVAKQDASGKRVCEGGECTKCNRARVNSFGGVSQNVLIKTKEDNPVHCSEFY